jgi:hypothetical protein
MTAFGGSLERSPSIAGTRIHSSACCYEQLYDVFMSVPGSIPQRRSTISILRIRVLSEFKESFCNFGGSKISR